MLVLKTVAPKNQYSARAFPSRHSAWVLNRPGLPVLVEVWVSFLLAGFSRIFSSCFLQHSIPVGEFYASLTHLQNLIFALCLTPSVAFILPHKILTLKSNRMQHPYFRFLNSLGAHSSAHGIEHFGNLYGELAGLEQHCWLCPLDRLGIIAVSGADAQNFLQAQFSNDIKQVSLEQGQLSGYASPQGRVLAIMQIFMPSQQQYCLSLPHNILQATLKRLSMFILRAQVKLEDISAQLLCAGLGGPGAEDTLVQLDIPVPQQTYAVSRSHECLILRMPDSSPRFAVFANEDRQQAFWQNSIPHIRPTTPYAWHLANIRNGLPSVYAETREQFVAQMLNLDRCNGISFKKGCYPGQEVIARLHYRGEAKRRMQSIRFSGMQAPALNSEIINQAQQVVGHLLEAAPCGETQYEGLAVLQLSLSQDEPLYFAGDPRIEVALMQ